MADVPPVIDMPEELPVLPLREFVVFPYMVLPLFIAREQSVAAVEDARTGRSFSLLFLLLGLGLLVAESLLASLMRNAEAA